MRKLHSGSRAATWNDIRSKRLRHALPSLFYYIVALNLCFVFIYPLLYMLTQAMMQPSDLMDGTVVWIPKGVTIANYIVALDKMEFLLTFKNTLILSLGGGVLQVLGCSLAAYGFARYRFPGSRIWFFLLLCAFLIPPQTMMVPLYLFFSDIGWTQSFLPMLVPSAFGHGLRGALFVLVFIQFFKGMPSQLEEASRIDGAGAYRTFFWIIMPLARPAILVVFLFSFVWHWNDLFEAGLYITTGENMTLSQKLLVIKSLTSGETSVLSDDTMGGASLEGPRLMAAAVVTILPLLLMYLFAQRYFVESIERTGLTGE
ncbi:carbohydrate ABC transporter permease [Paenibacillus chungangensis]|uniref:Carbohydrate ABC transporter permease n=1 Tax=Paenibacillus chungangensis TaxID=696535 RepID=A0ABW3HXW0_9BACL